jgi:hypothetical protein
MQPSSGELHAPQRAAPLVRSVTAPLSQEQGIRAQPDRPVTAPVTGHFLPLLRLAT